MGLMFDENRRRGSSYPQNLQSHCFQPKNAGP
uniref:Uncharacterized protein n=1 Tax=Rhizophora mucronata TaxID=61149 RepID=A0A2P2Q1Z2_RHIMU